MVDTLTYMIAGYIVIFSFILGYIVSLVVRFRILHNKVATYRTLLEEG
ncbi:MAG: hypothetical protein ACQEQQ_07310 [Chloroflexota bacterium]